MNVLLQEGIMKCVTTCSDVRMWRCKMYAAQRHEKLTGGSVITRELYETNHNVRPRNYEINTHLRVSSAEQMNDSERR